MTAPISQLYCTLECVLGLRVGSNMAFTFSNLCRDGMEALERQADREGDFPSVVTIVRGNALLSPVNWLLFMSFIVPITFPLWLTEGGSEGWGLEGMYAYEYVENWLGIDSFALCLVTDWGGFCVSDSTATALSIKGRHSGDKDRLAGTLHWHHHLLPESADYILEVDSLLSLWIAGGLNLLFFSG